MSNGGFLLCTQLRHRTRHLARRQLNMWHSWRSRSLFVLERMQLWGFDRLRPFKFCSMIRARGPTKRSLLMCRQQSGRRRFDNGSTSERWVL